VCRIEWTEIVVFIDDQGLNFTFDLFFYLSIFILTGTNKLDGYDVSSRVENKTEEFIEL
jgi:hypothetical protein